jgi:hypothetical protein
MHAPLSVDVRNCNAQVCVWLDDADNLDDVHIFHRAVVVKWSV